MKKTIAMLIMGIAIFSLTACGFGEDVQPTESPAAPTASAALETPAGEERPDAEAEGEAEQLSGTKAALDECMKLMGMEDAEAAEMLGGGEKNIAVDGSSLIGRIYKANIFGEDVEISTVYDGNGLVCSVTAMLPNPDAAEYAEGMVEIYGEPDARNDTPSESGATWQEWAVDGVNIRLWQMYELASVEISAAAVAQG